MAFTTDIKDEMCSLQKDKMELISELSGFVRNNPMNFIENFSLISENPKVVRRIYSCLKNIYDITCNVSNAKSLNLNKKRYYTIFVSDKREVVVDDLNILDVIPKEYLVDTEELQRAYLRGCFLTAGSINDPKTASYHMEMFIDRKEEADFICSLLNNFDLDSKVITRDKGYMVYIKRAEKIADFLRIIEANRAVLYYEDIRIYRDHKNMTNRLNNCEQANVDKIIDSCHKQLDDINLLMQTHEKDMIDEKIYEVMIYRQKYPELSLVELSEVISNETGHFITKSGLNHRFRKIKELADKIKAS